MKEWVHVDVYLSEEYSVSPPVSYPVGYRLILPRLTDAECLP